MPPLLRTLSLGLALGAVSLPVAALAEPVRLQLGHFESSVPAMSARTLQTRTLAGLKQALAENPEQATLLPGTELEGVEVRVDATLARSGPKYKLVYTLQTVQPPQLSHPLSYEYASPKLSNKGMVAMAQDILAQAATLEEQRKKQVAEAAPPAVAAAPAPAPEAPTAEPAPRPKSRAERIAEMQAQEAASPSSSSSSSSRDSDDSYEPELRSKPSGRNKVDLGLAAGFNSPSGIVGAELEFRPVEYVGLNLGAGFGAWGRRLSGQLRLYPLGARRASPFLEGGVSYNTGGESYLKSGDYAQYADLLPTPVATASLGLRGALGSHLYVVPRLGWGFRLRQDNVQTQDGSELNPLLDIAADLSQHGGFLASFTIGVTFL
ncbi:hypothetical protein [Hyalangium minutum]|uniref:Uncharacterized protein n=1 Tax=Hyalangium minutum TaxID=394096 RepID=A0A085W9B2_9BACT|nr:hypothetical protein [Hyalangium minutum]KFE64275.1 hypothetical protein DB31_2069 [Hyalangium minutum]